MSASPQTLHVLVHRAGLRQRAEEDWWGSPLETALAVAATSRHAPAYRDPAERALERLLRWWREGQPRRISADVVAVALTARATGELRGAEARLNRDAVERVVDLAGRDVAVVPDLHLALCVWALDGVALDRAHEPWPAVRERVARGRAYGFDAALRAYVRAVADERMDARQLVADLLAAPTVSPATPDASAMLWLLTVTVERVIPQLGEDDSGLATLIERRADLVGRLTTEIDATTWDEPDYPGLDADDALDLTTSMRLSPMETLLLDVALASPEGEPPYLSFAEARALFGERERMARADEARWIGRAGWLTATTSVLAAATLALSLALADVDAHIAVPYAVAVAAGGLAAASLLWRRRSGSAGASAVLGIWLTAALLAAARGMDASFGTRLFNDFADTALGGLVAALVAAAVVAAAGPRGHDRAGGH